MFVTLTSALTLLAQVQSVCPVPPSYVIAANDVDRFAVTVEFSHAVSQLDIPDRTSAEGEELADFILQPTQHADGMSAPLEYVGVGTWHMPFPNAERSHVTYQVATHHADYVWNVGEEEVGVQFDEAVYMVAWSVLLADYQLLDCTHEVRFDLPTGWQSIHPGQEIATNHYRSESLLPFLRNGFAFGQGFNRIHANFGNDQLTLIHSDALLPVADQLAEQTDAIVQAYSAFWGGGVGQDYIAFLMEGRMTDGGAFEDTFAQRIAMPLQDTDSVVWLHYFAHEIGHLWNGVGLRAGDELEWFTEGITDYLAVRVVEDLDGVPEDVYLRRMEKILQRYYVGLTIRQAGDFFEAGENKQQERFYLYGGGALIAWLLDLESQQTGGFETAMQTLYADRATPLTDGELRAVLEEHVPGAGEIIDAVEAGMDISLLRERLLHHGVSMAVGAPEEIFLSRIQ